MSPLRALLHAILLATLVSAIAPASARSVSYTGDGGDEGGTSIPQSCDVIDGYVDVAFDACWGIGYGNSTPAGKREWCTYELTEHNPFFLVTDIDGGAATLVFRQTLSSPVQLAFAGETDSPYNIGGLNTFNVTFGFLQGFSRGDELRFDFNSYWWDPIPGDSGTVRTISIHVGDGFLFESGADVNAGKSPIQAHKCQDPGSARR